VTNRAYIYPQSTSRIWAFDLLDDDTWQLRTTIDNHVPDRNEAGWYDYGNGYVVFNQDSGNVEWFSIGNGAYRNKVVRYNGDTGAFSSMGDLAHGTANTDNPVWTPEYGVLMFHGNGAVSNPTPGAGGPNNVFPDIEYSCYDCQAVYKNGKVYRAPGNNGKFTWLDLTTLTWGSVDFPEAESGAYYQLVRWGDKWIYIKGDKVVVFTLAEK
jgi:hypothetical protein